MEEFNKISYLEDQLEYLEYLELKAKGFKGYIPYSLFNSMYYTKVCIMEAL